MKTTIKTIMYLQMTALFLTAALAGPVAAEKQVPFKGSVQAVEIYDVQFPSNGVNVLIEKKSQEALT